MHLLLPAARRPQPHSIRLLPQSSCRLRVAIWALFYNLFLGAELFLEFSNNDVSDARIRWIGLGIAAGPNGLHPDLTRVVGTRCR